MLVRRKRIAEPGDVADVDEQCRFGQEADDFLAERILVADVDRDFLPGKRERRLLGAAAREVGERNFQYREHPAEGGWDEFSERNQVDLVVALDGRGAQAK